LVIGVTNRLKVSEKSIRQDGMMVAEKLAPLLGQNLKFDELDGTRIRDKDLTISGNDATRSDDNIETNANIDAVQKQTRSKCRK